MITIGAVLETLGQGIDPDDFASQLDQAMRLREVADGRALSVHDRDVLTSVGVPAADLDRPATPGVVEEAARLLDAGSQALPVASAAPVLGRSAARVRGGIADGSLYGVKVGPPLVDSDVAAGGGRPNPAPAQGHRRNPAGHLGGHRGTGDDQADR